MDAVIRQTLHVTLRRWNRSEDDVDDGGGGGGRGGNPLRSFLVTNLTVVFPDGRTLTGSAFDYDGGGPRTAAAAAGTAEDKAGAGYYVLAVLIVYSMSVVALLASHIKRKHVKILEDREIHKYLREFQVVKEKSSRDSYQNLKTAVIARLSKERGNTYRNLSRSVLPLLAVALPAGGGGGGREGGSTGGGSIGGGGLWESNVGFFLGTHPPPPPSSSAALPTLQETNVDGGDEGKQRGCRSSSASSAGWTPVDLPPPPPALRGGHHRAKMISTKSGSLDAATRLLQPPRNGPQRGSSSNHLLLLTASNSHHHSSRWPPRKVQSELAIDPALLGDPRGGTVDGVVHQAPVHRPFKGVSFDRCCCVDEVSPSSLTDDVRPETETMSLDEEEDDDVTGIEASPILPRDVSVAQNG